MKNSLIVFFTLFIIVYFFSCESNIKQKAIENMPKITADKETTPVSNSDDAADDPAIWYNKANPAKSVVIGTNKKSGLGFYNLEGKLLNFVNLGKVNNCDVQYGYVAFGDTFDIVGASNRSNNSISIYRYNPIKSSVDSVPLIEIPSTSEEVYGFCFYKNSSSEIYAISVGKDGFMEQFELLSDSASIPYYRTGSTYDFENICEGMVADNQNDLLFVAQEDRGIWAYNFNQGTASLIFDIDTCVNIQPDIEGLTLYYAENDKGYLIASSQGNSTYAIFKKNSPFKYIGSFAIIRGQNIDGTSETDGIDVLNLSLGEDFKYGLFITQDGNNFNDGIMQNQNFKLVSWKKIADCFISDIVVDTTFSKFDSF